MPEGNTADSWRKIPEYGWAEYQNLDWFFFSFFLILKSLLLGGWGEGSLSSHSLFMALPPGSPGSIIPGSSGGLEKGSAGAQSLKTPARKASPAVARAWGYTVWLWSHSGPMPCHRPEAGARWPIQDAFSDALQLKPCARHLSIHEDGASRHPAERPSLHPQGGLTRSRACAALLCWVPESLQAVHRPPACAASLMLPLLPYLKVKQS